MNRNITEEFIEALHDLEENNNVDRIASLFSENADVNNVATIDNSHHLDAREFWTKYRGNFGEVHSEFRNKIYGETSSALEWKTTGTGSDGGEVEYEGVSILEFDGERISRFFAYFNPSKLGRQMNEDSAKGNRA